jgi:hypothetical protein
MFLVSLTVYTDQLPQISQDGGGAQVGSFPAASAGRLEMLRLSCGRGLSGKEAHLHHTVRLQNLWERPGIPIYYIIIFNCYIIL